MNIQTVDRPTVVPAPGVYRLPPRRHAESTWPARLAIFAFLPIVRLRDIYPDHAALLAVLSLALLAMPLLFGRNHKLERDLQWWWWLPALLTFQLSLTLIFGLVPMYAMAGNAVTIAGAVLAGMVMYMKRFSVTLIVETVLTALACLVVLSTALYIAGAQPARAWVDHAGHSMMLRSVGLWVPRSGMPLTGGGVAHSTLSAVVLAGMLVQMLRGGKVSIIGLVAVPCALWGIAVGDGRAAAFGAILGVAYAVLHLPWLRWAALLPLGGAFLFSAVAALMPYSWAVALARTGDASEIAAGNGRADIWQAAFDYLLAHPLAIITGMGQYGQISSGIIRTMGRHTAFSDSAQLSMHNVGVQALIDGGLIGIGITALWLFHACKGLEKFPAAAAMMLVMLVAGVFGVWPSPYIDAGFFALLLLGMAGLVQIHRENGGVRAPRAGTRPTTYPYQKR